jgi:glucose-1-phosphate adenylyltransferase
VPLRGASDFGIVGVDPAGRVREFMEKPARPRAMPGKRDAALASMGIYVFRRDYLTRALLADSADAAAGNGAETGARHDFGHDFGHDIIPRAIREASVQSFRFVDSATGEPAYWRDIGTVERYWSANMDLLREPGARVLCDPDWPIWTRPLQGPPVRFGPRGNAADSIVSSACHVDGTVRRSILFTGAQVAAGALVHNALLLPGARVGRDCVIANAIIDSRCSVPDGSEIIGHKRDLASPELAPGDRISLLAQTGAQAPPTSLAERRVA